MINKTAGRRLRPHDAIEAQLGSAYLACVGERRGGGGRNEVGQRGPLNDGGEVGCELDLVSRPGLRRPGQLKASVAQNRGRSERNCSGGSATAAGGGRRSRSC